MVSQHWAKKFRKDFDKRRVDILQGRINDREYNIASREMAGNDYFQQFVDAGVPMTEANLEEIKEKSKDAYMGYYDPRIDDLLKNTPEAKQRKEFADEVDRLEAAGVDTSTLLSDPNIPYGIKKKSAAGLEPQRLRLNQRKTHTVNSLKQISL